MEPGGAETGFRVKGLEFDRGWTRAVPATHSASSGCWSGRPGPPPHSQPAQGRSIQICAALWTWSEQYGTGIHSGQLQAVCSSASSTKCLQRVGDSSLARVSTEQAGWRSFARVGCERDGLLGKVTVSRLTIIPYPTQQWMSRGAGTHHLEPC